MKKFSKKLALMLVLAMIVGMFSGVLTASAANAPFTSNGFSFATSDGALKNGMTLRVAGKTETTAKQWYTVYKDGAKVNGSSEYSVVYSVDTDGETMLVLGTEKYNGLVRAKSVGLDAGCRLTATIFDANDEKVAQISTAIYVRESAAKLEITNKDAAAEALIVGKTLQLTSLFYNAAGQSADTAARKTYVTDYTKWTSSDETIATVDATGLVTAVKEGTAKITVATYVAKDFSGTATQTAEVEITVKAAVAKVVSAAPKTYKVITVAFDSEFATAPAVEDIAVKNVTTGIKAVVASTKLTDDKKVVEVTLYLDLINEKEYSVTYKESTASFTANIGKVAQVVVNSKDVVVSTATEIKAGTHYSFLDANGVDITANVDPNYVTFDVAFATYGYFDTGSPKKVTFYNVGNTATLKVTYTFPNEFDANGAPVTLSQQATLTSVAATAATVAITATKVAQTSGANTTSMKLALGDAGYSLYTKFKIGDATVDFGTLAHSGKAVTFTSTDVEKLLVDPATGALYPIKAGKVAVLINYDGKNVGVAEVEIGAARVATSMTLDKSSINLSKGVAADTATIKVTVKDQYDADFVSGALTCTAYNAGPIGTIAGKEITLNGNLGFAAEGTYSYKLTYAGLTRNFVVVVKNPAAASSYQISLTKDSVDLKLATGDAVAQTITASVNSYDASNYFVGAVTGGFQYEVVYQDNTVVVAKTAVDTANVSYTVRSTSGTQIVKAKTGNYIVKVYKNNEGVFLTKSFTVTDTQATPVITSAGYEVDVLNANAATSAEIIANFTAKINDVAVTVDSVDFVQLGTNIYVKSITVKQTIDGNDLFFTVTTPYSLLAK